MGGLIAQQALLDNPALSQVVHHLFLFGTPSAGLRKAAFLTSLLGLFVGDQVHNMANEGEYIRQLRSGWTQAFGRHQVDCERTYPGTRAAGTIITFEGRG
jgi:hypothetical protein